MDFKTIILQAKCTAVCWSSTLTKKQKGGDNIDCCKEDLWLLNKWTQILEFFYCQNYSEDDVYTENENSYLVLEDAEVLGSKVRKLIGL